MKPIEQILDSGTKDEKIQILEKLASSDDFELIKKMIGCLDDPDIQVRGEAFSSLILNKNDLSELLIESLKDPRKNVRGFVSLVLGNRKDINGITKIAKLVNDESSMVRSCALGALGHLKANEVKDVIRESIYDKNLEVKKSAMQALINLDEKISENEILEISKEKDSEMDGLIIKLKKGGPEGI